LLAGVISFTSCSSDDATYQATPKLEVTSADVLFEAPGGNGTIVVNASGAVTATTTANWLTLSVQGNNVVVSANPNITLEGRSGLIKILSGDTEAEVTATQKGSVYGIPSLEYKMGDYQASLNIDVVHNLPVTVESQADWLTAVFNEETSQIELVAEDNDEADSRVGIVIVTMGDYSDEISVTQSGLLLEPEKEILSTKNEAETLTFAVSHSRSVTVSTEDDWITATWDAKKSIVTCEVTANETGWRRTGTITLTSGPVTKTVTISQFDFVENIQGEYQLVYYSSGWKAMGVVLEATSETAGTLTWKGKYTVASGPFVVPISIDAATRSFSIKNWVDMEQTYTMDDQVYTLTVLAMQAYQSKLYLLPSQYVSDITATLEEDETGIYFNFDGSYGSYEFYGIRIGYGAGGYDGYAGSFTSYPYCYLIKL